MISVNLKLSIAIQNFLGLKIFSNYIREKIILKAIKII
jgi:hypothetical protein